MNTDMLLVRGDPTQDVSLVQHQSNLALTMKDGKLHKDPRIQAGQQNFLIRAAE